MKTDLFDPFGEPGTQSLQDVSGGSRLVERAGLGVFWAMVIAIVATRAVYFDEGLADQLRFVASLAKSALTALV